MTQEPRREVEVHGGVGDPVVLPLGNDGAAAYTWTLDLPDGVEQADELAAAQPGSGPASRLRVRATRPGSYVLVASLADPSTGVAMTVLPIRLTVA